MPLGTAWGKWGKIINLGVGGCVPFWWWVFLSFCYFSHTSSTHQIRDQFSRGLPLGWVGLTVWSWGLMADGEGGARD